MYILLIVFILKLSLRPRRLIHPAKYIRNRVAGWVAGCFQVRVAGLPQWNRRMMSGNEWEVKKEENNWARLRYAQVQVFVALQPGTLVSFLGKLGSGGITAGQEGRVALLWRSGLRL